MLRDDNGSPIANAEVKLVDHTRNDRQATTTTNGGGYYEVLFETATTGMLLIHAGGRDYEESRSSLTARWPTTARIGWLWTGCGKGSTSALPMPER